MKERVIKRANTRAMTVGIGRTCCMHSAEIRIDIARIFGVDSRVE
jgi:hypothetical protein